MKSFLVATATFLLAASAGFSQKKGIFISDAAVEMAQKLQIDYKGLVKKASAKDTKALTELFEFTVWPEGALITEHVQTCLELIPVVTDEVYAKALESRHPGLKAFLLRHIPAAQERTAKENLKKPLQEWAPYTWEALNGREVNIPEPKAATKDKVPSPSEIDAAQLKPSADKEAPKATGGTLVPAGAPDATKGNQLTPARGRRGNQ